MTCVAFIALVVLLKGAQISYDFLGLSLFRYNFICPLNGVVVIPAYGAPNREHYSAMIALIQCHMFWTPWDVSVLHLVDEA